jgi:nucleoside-diphosphate-sugar epimerase
VSPLPAADFPFKNCLVTGGAGFIGSHLVERLLNMGCKVRVIDNLSTGKRENLAHLNALELVEGNIEEEPNLEKCLKDIEIVFHLAARTSVPRSLQGPEKTNLVNATGSLLLARLASEMGVKVLVYSSSSSIYGDKPNPRKSESMLPQPKSPYAVSKLAGEYYSLLYGKNTNMRVIALRYFNVFGPRQDPSSPYSAVVPRFISATLNRQQAFIFGDGKQTRDFTYVEDVVTANILSAANSGHKPQAINIGSGKRTSIIQLLQIVQSCLPDIPPIPPIHKPPRTGDVLHSQANIQKAEVYLGYKPRVTLRDGIQKTIEWFRRS